MFGAKQAVKLLEKENERLRQENQRLAAQNDELVRKVMALSNEGAYLLSNPTDRVGDPILSIDYDEWGQEVIKEGAN